jgi:hypothetical protein
MGNISMTIYNNANLLNKNLHTKKFDEIIYQPNNVYIFESCIFEMKLGFYDEIKRDKTSKIVIINDYVPFNPRQITVNVNEIKKHNLPTNQIYYLCEDKFSIKHVQDLLELHQIHDLNVDGKNFFSHYFQYNSNIKPFKPFSVFSRTMKNFRLQFFVDLFTNNLLNYANYTFVNGKYSINNNYENGPLTEDEVQYYLKTILQEQRTVKLENWLRNIPYEYGKIGEINDDTLNRALLETYLHIVLETELENSPQITEKTFRAIFLKRPFICYTAPNSLRYLHDRGYKTFHPIIDESYDNIVDTEKRKKMIIHEIKRICDMNRIELERFSLRCKPIIDYNYTRYNFWKNKELSPKFKELGIF